MTSAITDNAELPPSSSTEASTSTSTSTYKLHLHPLPPSSQLPSSEIMSFFKRFGTPLSFDRPGLDGFGEERAFGYLGIDFGEKGEKGLTRCINLTSSSTWRGIKLKVAVAKPGYETKLKTEALPPVLTEKQLRSLKLKKRRDRKRRIVEADGGRCDGDMRMVNPELVQAGKRKHWHIVEGEEDTIVRPIFTRPTHPLPPAENPIVQARATTGQTTSSSANPLKRKKQRKSRTKPPTKSKRVWIDPSIWKRAHLAWNDKQAGTSSEEMEVDGMWAWEDSLQEQDLDGRWVFRPSSTSAEQEVSVLEPEVVPSKDQRLQSALDKVAQESIWPAEYLDIVPTITGKGGKTRPTKSSSGRTGEEVLTLEDLGGMVDDEDDAMWGAVPGELGGGLFDDGFVEVKQGSGAGAVKVSRKQAVVVDAADLDIGTGLEDDDLFGSAPVPAKVSVKETSASPLFGSRSLPAQTSSKKQKKGEALPSDISNDFTEDGSSEAGSMDDDDDMFAGVPQPITAGKGTSLKDVVKKEKNAGLAVLSALGFDLDDAKVSQPKEQARPIGGDESSDESDWAPTMRLRGGATDAEMKSASEASSSSSSDSSSDSSSSSSGDSSSEDSSSDDEEDNDEDEDMENVANGPTESERQETKQQTLKDMFAPKADEPTGFSLFAGLDLDLDSDLEEDLAVPQPKPAQPVTAPVYIPAPAVTGKTSDLFSTEAGKPFFFFDTQRSLAGPMETVGQDDLGRKWLGTVQSLQGETMEVKPFVRTDTDEQMTTQWRESKVELTREWKKRHREAVKRVKRGMGSGGAAAGTGEFGE